MWTEYNKINDLYQKEILRRKKPKYLSEYKVLEEEKSVELEKKFISEYKNKLIKLKEEVESKIESIEEERRKYLSIDFQYISSLLKKILDK